MENIIMCYGVIDIFTKVLMHVPNIMAAEPVQTTVKLDLSNDLITLIRFAVWGGAILLLALAGIGVAFFGFDIRKARGSITDMTSELKKLIEEAKKEYELLRNMKAEMIELKQNFDVSVADSKNKIEELGAMIEAMADTSPREGFETGVGVASQATRTDTDLILDIIRGSNFQWTTIHRLMKRSGLDRDKILEITRSIPDVEINIGKKSRDHIFRLRTV